VPASERIPAQKLSRRLFPDTLLPVAGPPQDVSRCMPDSALLKIVLPVITFELVHTSIPSKVDVPKTLLEVTVTPSPVAPGVVVIIAMAMLLLPAVFPETAIEPYSLAS
jgi:hypothetical protein